MATEPDAQPSPLGLQLTSPAKDEPAPQPLPPDRRLELANARVNTQLKAWRLTALLGAGPVTAAYEANRGSKDAHERAVLKIMIGETARHGRARSLFLRSAYAANRFNHPRVLPVMEDGTDGDGAPYVVRPWVEAEPLAKLVHISRLEESQVLRIAEQILDALEMAHAHGILHGAITPENILVTPRGSIRLCDFATPPGIGTTVRSVDEDILTPLRGGPFAAPERRRQPPEAASEAADIYSAGACLYYALSQKQPRAEGRDEARSLREVAPQVSEPLANVIDHALHFDPVRRYESAYAMLGDVRRVMAGRRPKLADAACPVPSASLAELRNMPSSNRGPASARRLDSGRPPPSPSRAGSAYRRHGEWRGNVILILAIATLVGVATFVLVREKVSEERARPEPPSSQE